MQEDAFPFQRVSAFITITACTWHSIRVEEHTTTALSKSAEWPILTYMMLVARFPFEVKDVVVASLSLLQQPSMMVLIIVVVQEVDTATVK